MSNVTYEQALSILGGWTGTPKAKMAQWTATYNWVGPPSPADLVSDATLAQYIADNYTGPVITG